MKFQLLILEYVNMCVILLSAGPRFPTKKLYY